MKFIDEYRDADSIRHSATEIGQLLTQPRTLMEICGGQTHAILHYGLQKLLPEGLSLVHGPGCPVCVTPVELIDKALALAARPEITFCSFGDMLRVPGSDRDLLSVKADGGDVRIVYSPLDALELARQHPDRQVVFFAIGFETTAPTTGMAAYRAKRESLHNFSLLVAHVRVPPAMSAILSSPHNRVQGFLAAGHVCTVMGYREYEAIAKRFHIPIVVTGFEPLDIMQGIYLCLRQLEAGRAEVENQYRRSVRVAGNESAQQLLREVFEWVPRHWRGIGLIPDSGLGLRSAYAEFDAERRFDLVLPTGREGSDCIAGEILQGVKSPLECPEFGRRCTPEHPLGAPMVSSEGACAAYFRYRQHPALLEPQ
ncbi:hydrogenase formation protein HypD [Synechococcus sp. PCC 7336]|uniref:hydrogenase formation protein HypD n=1 Tax=Synechococcus sp. PCC 7336 TaxID=195250 RepID=UPI000347207A|nr:hydrogenase formation protein HypD [Synechococcus sp. PCC 7336]